MNSTQNPNVILFGCDSTPGRYNPGHYVTDRQNPRRRYAETPWREKLDGGLLDGVPDSPDGKVVVAKKDGWTAIAFWDRSGDSRPASNTVFMIDQDMEPTALLELARQQWPQIFARPYFPKLKMP